jgi:hypothetical protein
LVEDGQGTKTACSVNSTGILLSFIDTIAFWKKNCVEKLKQFTEVFVVLDIVCLVFWTLTVWFFRHCLFGVLDIVCLVFWTFSVWCFGHCLFGVLDIVCLVFWTLSVFCFGHCLSSISH